MGRPKYIEIAADVYGKVQSGELSPGNRLPSHSEARKQYGVSTSTVIVAYQLLKFISVIRGRQGSGYYVLDHADVKCTGTCDKHCNLDSAITLSVS